MIYIGCIVNEKKRASGKGMKRASRKEMKRASRKGMKEM